MSDTFKEIVLDATVKELLVDLAAAREHASISIARASADGLRTEAAETELARLREKCYYADLSDSAHAAVRELLMANDVPMAAFIDDHVGNAIVQRDAARAEADGLAGLLAKALPELLNHGGDWDLRLRIRNVLAARAQPAPAQVSE